MSTSPQYTLQRWEAGGTEDSLPQNTVTAIVQTRDGYLWIGTYSGLARFDGVRFTLFSDNNSPGMASSRVTSLFEAEDGTLWIGHETGEVSSYRAGKFQKAAVTAKWSGGKIQNLTTDAAGDVWLLNAGEGLLARLRDGLVLTPESGTAAKLFEVTRSSSGRIWVARNGRVSELRDAKLFPLPFTEALTNHYVAGIGASRDGGLWVVTGEHMRKWKDNAWTDDQRVAPWWPNPMHNLIEMKSGTLTLSGAGVAMIHGGNKAPLIFNRTNGFPSDWIISLCEDREGNLWVGTGGGGLAVLRPGVLQTLSPPDQWLGRAVLSVHPSRNGTLWIGTEGAGLYEFHNGEWNSFGVSAGINVPYVWSVIEDAQDRLWVGTWNGMLVRRGNRFEIAPGLESVTESTTALLEARGGGLWVGTGIGLLRYESGKSSWPGQEGRPAKRDVRAIAETREGTVWFGTAGGGLGRLKGEQVQWFHKTDGLASEYIGCLHLETDDTLWIGTLGGGLNRFKDGRFATVGPEHGLPNNFISHIEDDGLGFFWMSSHNGLMRVAKAELNAGADGAVHDVHFRTYGLSDGMPTLNCSSGLQAAGCKTADGRLWFATSRGLVAVTPANVKTNTLPPPVVVERMSVDEKNVSLADVGGRPQRISPGRHRIEFQYSGLSFIGSERIQFKHRLQNWESDWVNSGVKRAVNYNYLPPGDYEFEVAARNNDGIWCDQNAKVAFTVLPFFWQTLWFRIVAGAVLVMGATGVVWFDTRRRMRRKLEKLERQRAVESERARIAKDIHDDLGSTLTQITMLSDPARGREQAEKFDTENLGRIHATARDLTRAMDEIVWAVNPHHDTVDSLVAYLEKVASDLLRTANIRCRLEVPLEFPVVPLSAEARHNLFLAFKEALNNIIRHSAATEVHISFALTPSGLSIVVKDNGHGFRFGRGPRDNATAADRTRRGNGLLNMRRRLASVGGTCEIESMPGQGTTVTFAIASAPTPA